MGLSANRVDVLDLSSHIAPVRRLNTSPGNPNVNMRWDVLPGAGGVLTEHINILNLSTYVTVRPPMLGGELALNKNCPGP